MAEKTNLKTKLAIQRELKKYLATAQEKERLMLLGLAEHFCAVHKLQPEQIEMVKTMHGTETRFHFRKRDGALFLPGGRA